MIGLYSKTSALEQKVWILYSDVSNKQVITFTTNE